MQDPPSPHGFEKNGNLGFKMNDLSKIKDFIHNMWIWSFPKNEYPKSSKVTSWPVDQFSIETHGFFGDLVRNPYVCICQCIEYRAQCIRYGELNTSIGSTTLCNTIYISIYITKHHRSCQTQALPGLYRFHCHVQGTWNPHSWIENQGHAAPSPSSALEITRDHRK
jgi:hypothetical protein